MKPIQISRDIVPLAQLKAGASKILRQMQDHQRPVVITQNGRAAAVLLTPDLFDYLQGRERFLGSIRSGLEDSDAGRLVSDDDLRQELDAEFGE